MFAFEGREPTVSPAAWIAPTATLIGDVLVEADASVWYGAVLRADFGPIIVRRGANVQDGSVLHGGTDPVTEVGEGAGPRHRSCRRRLSAVLLPPAGHAVAGGAQLNQEFRVRRGIAGLVQQQFESLLRIEPGQDPAQAAHGRVLPR